MIRQVGSTGSRTTGAVSCLLLLCGVGRGASAPLEEDKPVPSFVERSAELGIDFEHRHFGTGEKYMPENMAPGVTVFDYDGDGRLDLYFAQGRTWAGVADRTPAEIAGRPPALEVGNRLFRQNNSGRFEEVGRAAGVEDVGGYGMGASFGDVDRDGDPDLYVTNYGANRLFRNLGEGRFEDATGDPAAPLAVPAWSTGSGFFDADADGDLDLYVVNYLDFDPASNTWCGNAQAGLRSYCHPDLYPGARDALLTNLGDGRFADATAAAGLAPAVGAKGLGLVLQDLDGDGRQDIFVANDSTMNHLYLGGEEGRFRDAALIRGVAVNGSGQTEASMGVALGDLNADGLPDLLVTHLDQETNTLYLSRRGGFVDATGRAGLAAPSLPWVGFGTVLFDFDNDTDLDLFVANGHIIDNIERFDPARSYRQPAQLFENTGDGKFVDRSAVLGLREPLVGRGAVAADLDRDGDLDLVVAQNNARALVLENRVGAARPSFAVRLRGVQSNVHGFGARLELTTTRGRQVRWMESTSSYVSQGPDEVYFGLGDAAVEALTVYWPSGRIDRHPSLRPGALYTLREGEPSARSTPFSDRAP